MSSGPAPPDSTARRVLASGSKTAVITMNRATSSSTFRRVAQLASRAVRRSATVCAAAAGGSAGYDLQRVAGMRRLLGFNDGLHHRAVHLGRVGHRDADSEAE